MDNDLVDKLRERYPSMHPLMFQRSVERTKNFNDLFDVLETFQTKFPIVWEAGRWVATKDFVQISKFEFEEETKEEDADDDDDDDDI